MVPLQIHADLHRAEVIVAPQMDDLLQDLGVRGMRTRLGAPGSIPQAFHALGLVTAQSRVVELAADPEVSTGQRDIAADLLDMVQHRQLAMHCRIIYGITHRSPNIKRPRCQRSSPVLDKISFRGVQDTPCGAAPALPAPSVSSRAHSARTAYAKT